MRTERERNSQRCVPCLPNHSRELRGRRQRGGEKKKKANERLERRSFPRKSLGDAEMKQRVSPRSRTRVAEGGRGENITMLDGAEENLEVSGPTRW